MQVLLPVAVVKVLQCLLSAVNGAISASLFINIEQSRINNIVSHDGGRDLLTSTRKAKSDTDSPIDASWIVSGQARNLCSGGTEGSTRERSKKTTMG
jgi:hypothetical protein